MHLHHELQRALADTKIDATTPPLVALPDEQRDPERTPAVTRRILSLIPHRPARRDRRRTGTLGARQP